MGQRFSWSELTRAENFRGRWVALDQCRYDRGATHPAEGEVVDADEDLALLCHRVREQNHSHCAIVFCDEERESLPAREGPVARFAVASPR